MAIPNVDVNYWAVFVVGVINMIIGALWYSPILFGNIWMKLSGVKKENMSKMKKDGKVGKSYFFAFIVALISACVLAYFVKYVTVTSFADGMELGFWLWLGFVAPVQLSIVLWDCKPFKLYLINTSHQLVALLISAGILAIW